MGICESINEGKSKGAYKIVKIDGEIKDIENDYLLPQNIASRVPITNKYKLSDSKVGQGASGIVYTGIDKNGIKYAVKSIKKKNIMKGQFLINEARIGLKLVHPYIIPIKEVYEDMKQISFVMELCEGGDLFDFITQGPNQKLDNYNTIEMLIQILDCINYLHNSLHVCHRDLKPENFLVKIDEKNNPSIRLIDFGFATYFEPEKKMTENLGTLTYSAPEIIKKEPYDEKIDIWSIGILLFNMMTGCEPFAGTRDELKQQILSQPINFEVLENKPLKELCQKLLERDPTKRIDAKTALEYAKNIKKEMNSY